MEAHIATTRFAPAEREPASEVLRQHQAMRGHFIAHTLDALPLMVLVLNRCRQIVLANSRAVDATGSRQEELLGKRPGEAFNCIHADLCPGGCGTSEYCARCGAVISILRGLKGHAGIEEYALLRGVGEFLEAMDLQVSSAPIRIEESDYVLFTIQDQGDLMRRRALERLFLHDMLNTVGGLRGFMDLLREQVPERLKPEAQFVRDCLSGMAEELKAHRELAAAENNELVPEFIPLSARAVLDSVASMSLGLARDGGKGLCVGPDSADAEFVSDLNLLKRVLGNMIKNALEASLPGEEVTISSQALPEGVRFKVHNPAPMAEEARLRVFKRNFSTKGPGRGLGTYGMKLLGERYLGGEVSFTSSDSMGTAFVLVLPAAPDSHRLRQAHAATLP